MENQKMPEYETIRAAVAGEKWAVEKVVDCYKDEIDRLSTVAVRQPDGSTKQEINEDMRQSITMGLVGAVRRVVPLHFPYNAPRFRFNQPVPQCGDMRLEIPRRKLLPAAPFFL